MDQKTLDGSLASRLSRLVAEEMDGDVRASPLVRRFVEHRTYQRAFCLDLLDIARTPRSWTWEVRRLAVLMLEHQVLKLPEHDHDEFSLLLARLGILPATHANGHVRDSMRKEGYSTTQTTKFIAELRRRLERLNRVHLPLDATDVAEQAMRDFIDASRSDCKFTLLRYLLTPDEVVERIVGRLKRSTGVTDMRLTSSLTSAARSSTASSSCLHSRLASFDRCASVRRSTG